MKKGMKKMTDQEIDREERRMYDEVRALEREWTALRDRWQKLNEKRVSFCLDHDVTGVRERLAK